MPCFDNLDEKIGGTPLQSNALLEDFAPLLSSRGPESLGRGICFGIVLSTVEVTLATPYKIHLDAYDGPLDLLLDLIRKQEMDIHNIPIAKITGQYLEYLHKLEELDIDVSADFIYMAATLILIKSKMLLPPDPLAGPEEQIDPRAELVHRLVEHEKFKSAAQLLYQKQQIEAHVWSKPDLSLYEGEETAGRAGGFAGRSGARLPAGAGAAQGSHARSSCATIRSPWST